MILEELWRATRQIESNIKLERSRSAVEDSGGDEESTEKAVEGFGGAVKDTKIAVDDLGGLDGISVESTRAAVVSSGKDVEMQTCRGL